MVLWKGTLLRQVHETLTRPGGEKEATMSKRLLLASVMLLVLASVGICGIVLAKWGMGDRIQWWMWFSPAITVCVIFCALYLMADIILGDSNE